MKRSAIALLAFVAMMSLAIVGCSDNSDEPEGLVRQDSARAVTDEHIDALNNCSVERLMAQYPESIHIILPGGATTEGRADVQALFEGFCLPFADGGLNGLKFTEVKSWQVEDTINMQWSADACFLDEPYLGADAYEASDGLMAAQVTTFDGAQLVMNDGSGC